LFRLAYISARSGETIRDRPVLLREVRGKREGKTQREETKMFPMRNSYAALELERAHKPGTTDKPSPHRAAKSQSPFAVKHGGSGGTESLLSADSRTSQQ